MTRLFLVLQFLFPRLDVAVGPDVVILSNWPYILLGCVLLAAAALIIYWIIKKKKR